MDLRKRPLVAGAAALFLAGVANRIIGTIYRVLLVRTAGEEVVGLVQMSLPIYRVASTLATAGLFVAIARLAADARGARDAARARAYGRTGLTLTLCTALLAAAFLFLTRRLFANHFLTDPRTVVTLALFPLLLVPAALSQSLRGVLQGEERLTPVALSSFIEATSRVPIVLLLVAWLLPYGPQWAAGGVVVGLTAGEVLSLLYLAGCVRRSWAGAAPAPRRSRGGGRRRRRGRWLLHAEPPLVKALAAVALPVLFTGLVNGILGMFNVALIPRQLMSAGLEAAEATVQYGRLFGMALPILYMPMVAVHPLAHAAVPAVARRLAEGRRASVRRLLVQCFSVAAAVGALTAFALWNFGEELGLLLYGVGGLGTLIAPLALAAPFTYIGHVASGILYGLGRTGITMASSVAGNVVRLGLVILLVSDPRWGIVGALLAVVADYVLTALLDIAAVAVLMRRALGRPTSS